MLNSQDVDQSCTTQVNKLKPSVPHSEQIVSINPKDKNNSVRQALNTFTNKNEEKLLRNL